MFGKYLYYLMNKNLGYFAHVQTPGLFSGAEGPGDEANKHTSVHTYTYTYTYITIS